MFCPKCGNNVENGIAFCPTCGNPMQAAAAAQAEYVAPAAPEEPAGFELPGAAKDLPGIKQKFNPKDILNKIKGVKLSGPKKIAIIAVAVVLVLAIVISSIVMSIPAIAITKAVDKTVLDSSSFEFSISAGSYKLCEGMVDFGKNFQESGFYIEAQGTEMGYFGGEFKTSYGQEIELEDVLDEYNEMMEDSDYDFNLDPEETLNRIIKKEIREEEILKIYDENKEVFEEMIADMTDEEIVLPKSKEIKSMVKDYIKHLPDGCVEIEKDRKNGKKVYEYEIDVEEFLIGLVEYTSEKSKYEEYYQYLEDIADMDADDLIDIIEECEFENIEGEIKIKGGYITEASIDMYGEELSIKFKNVNKTKVEEDLIDDIGD